jgi:hypothetical protein
LFREWAIGPRLRNMECGVMDALWLDLARSRQINPRANGATGCADRYRLGSDEDQAGRNASVSVGRIEARAASMTPPTATRALGSGDRASAAGIAGETDSLADYVTPMASASFRA